MTQTKDERRAYEKAYKAANRERINARQRARYASDAEFRRKSLEKNRENYDPAKARDWAEKNREKVNENRRVKYNEDPETRARTRKTAKEVYDRGGKEYYREYYKKNRERIRKRSQARLYGMTPDDLDAIHELQQGKCALCGIAAEMATRGQLVVDHCHENGHVRGLLCQPCNTELGVIEKRRHEISRWLSYADSSRPLQDIVKSDRNMQ